MSEKNANVKKEINKVNNDILVLVEKKIDFFKDVIQKTIIHVQRNKFLDILGISDVSLCIERLGELSKKITEINQYEIQLKDALENTKKTELLELNFKNDLEKIRSELVLLKENKLDSNTLLELEKWYSNQDLFQLKITSLVDAVSKVKEEIQVENKQ